MPTLKYPSEQFPAELRSSVEDRTDGEMDAPVALIMPTVRTPR